MPNRAQPAVLLGTQDQVPREGTPDDNGKEGHFVLVLADPRNLLKWDTELACVSLALGVVELVEPAFYFQRFPATLYHF
jgi:hypothetical protein